MPYRVHSLARPFRLGASAPAAPSAALPPSVPPAAVSPLAAAHPSPLGDVRAPHSPAVTLQSDETGGHLRSSLEPSCAVGGCRAPRHHGSRAHFCAYHDTVFKDRVYDMTRQIGRGTL